MLTPKFKRILLKISGESLQGKKNGGIDFDALKKICEQIVEINRLKCEVAVVIGAGNLWRHRDSEGSGVERVSSDNIGMLATIMNALAMQSVIEEMKTVCRVCSALNIPQVCEPYLRRKAIRHLEKGRIVILAAGTGNPFFTTDSAAALRALELDCEILLKATNVEGIYDSDPKKNSQAKIFHKISFQEVLEKDLRVMDTSAISLCRDGKLPIVVFDLEKEGNIKKVVCGEKVGTRVE